MRNFLLKAILRARRCESACVKLTQIQNAFNDADRNQIAQVRKEVELGFAFHISAADLDLRLTGLGRWNQLKFSAATFHEGL